MTKQTTEQRLVALEKNLTELAQSVLLIAQQGDRNAQATAELADQIIGFQKSFADYLASSKQGGAA